MEVQLKVLVGGSAGKTIKVSGPKFFIGRSEECHLRPNSDLIGRHHCAIIIEGDYVAVHDFGSKNGTYVNGERVSSQRELKTGDRLSVGPLEFEVCFDMLRGPKRPPVSNIKEAAERTADSGVSKKLDDIDLEDWLGKDISGGDTSKIRESSESTAEGPIVLDLDSGTASGEPVPPPKPGDEKPKPDAKKSGDSGDAAAEMLRKLRRFR